MRKILLLPLLAVSVQSLAQRKPEKILFESECPQYEYCKECGDIKAVFTGKLKRYFEKELNFRDLELIEGVIIVQVAVDSTGTACANRFYNFTTNTSEEVNRLKLAWMIQKMPKWQPAIVSGQPVNSFVQLAFYGKVEDRPLFDVDYLRNDKKKAWIVKTKNEPIFLDYRTLEPTVE